MMREAARRLDVELAPPADGGQAPAGRRDPHRTAPAEKWVIGVPYIAFDCHVLAGHASVE
jgi:hypothetical protein